MTRTYICAGVLLGLLFSQGAQAAEDAESIISKAREMQIARWDGVDNYTVTQSVAGTRAVIRYERVDETSFRIAGQINDGATVDFDDIQEMMKSAELLGTESFDGRKGFHLKTDDVERIEEMGDQDVDYDTYEIWIDTKDYVPLKMRIHGTATGPEGPRPVVISVKFSDYRKVPGSELFEAYRHTMKMGGVLDANQQKELQEGMKQMAEMEAQLASMPEAQRKMVEQMMGPKIEMMKKMASGGAIEVITEVVSITVNTGN